MPEWNSSTRRLAIASLCTLALSALVVWLEHTPLRASLIGFLERVGQGHHDDAYGSVLWRVSQLGHGHMLAFLIAALAIWVSDRRQVQDSVVMLLLASAIGGMLKLCFDRERPFGGEGLGWPSGHAYGNAAIALSLYRRAPIVRTLAWAFAIAVMVSRILSHRHWPGDVLGGLAVALAAAAIARSLPPLLPGGLASWRARATIAALAVLVAGFEAAVAPGRDDWVPLAAPLLLTLACAALLRERAA